METTLLTSSDYDAVMHFLCEDFLLNEPLCSAVCMTKDEFAQAFHGLIMKCCESGVSFKTNTKDAIIGVVLSLSYTAYLVCSQSKANLSPKIMFITNILEQLSVGYEPNDESIYIFIVSSSSEEKFRNKGVAKNLINESIKKGRDLGFKEFIVDATNMITQLIFGKHFGFKMIKEVVTFSSVAARMSLP